ncbi:MAG: dihydrodipicolinate synthase family protein [Verrucomicrobiales bacterium]|nr:dihydrodipicolinate synthase family protein [Verrucomicrobiales bacterium]
MHHEPLRGLIAAAYTPFNADGSLRIEAIEQQAEHFLRNRLSAVFITGTTGENHSLTADERRRVATRWVEVTRGTPLRVIVHVGGNCLVEAGELATHAQQAGAFGIAAMAPSYFKPADLETLIAGTAQVAANAPELPFYYYDIPVMTGVKLSAAQFLERATDRIPTLGGVKFSNPDLAELQLCLAAAGPERMVAWGIDEALLAVLALGVTSAVGSTYNFAAPIAHRLLAAFENGDAGQARIEQLRLVRLVQTLSRHGYMAASKAVMKLLGIDLGSTRLPLPALPPPGIDAVQRDLQALGFFDWLRP